MDNTILDTIMYKKQNKNNITLFFMNILEIIIALMALIIILFATYTSNNNSIKSLLYVGMIATTAILLDGYISLNKKDN